MRITGVPPSNSGKTGGNTTDLSKITSTPTPSLNGHSIPDILAHQKGVIALVGIDFPCAAEASLDGEDAMAMGAIDYAILAVAGR
ncbi:hypothetical protein F52700_12119 [Fusarium sp. NRRL 52700]|nr:hypothetical protein F52700_12119 [Fusarium sp. NRRL 52700]